MDEKKSVFLIVAAGLIIGAAAVVLGNFAAALVKQETPFGYFLKRVVKDFLILFTEYSKNRHSKGKDTDAPQTRFELVEFLL